MATDGIPLQKIRATEFLIRVIVDVQRYRTLPLSNSNGKVAIVKCQLNEDRIEVEIKSWNQFGIYVQDNYPFDKKEVGDIRTTMKVGLGHLTENLNLANYTPHLSGRTGQPAVENTFSLFVPNENNGYWDADTLIEIFRQKNDRYKRDKKEKERKAAEQKQQKAISLPTTQPLPPLTPRKFNVPYLKNAYFTGREQELTALHHYLTQNRSMVISQAQAISGLGGVGKTQLAVEYAYQYFSSPSKPDSFEYVFWVRADTSINLSADVAVIADQLALTQKDTPEDLKIDTALRWLENNEQWLLVFDNADDSSLFDTLIDLMPKTSRGKILITSRASTFAQLSITAPLQLDTFATETGVEMIFRRIGRSRAEDQEEAQAAAELNQELGGLPLALEQAGAYIATTKCSIKEYLSMYRQQGVTQLKKKPETGRYPLTVLRTWQINFNAVGNKSPESLEILKISSFLSPDNIPFFLFLEGSSELGESLNSAVTQRHSPGGSRLKLLEMLVPLSEYSLVNWQVSQEFFFMHRLVQAVVRDDIDSQKEWISRLIKALKLAQPFYSSDYEHSDKMKQIQAQWLSLDGHLEPIGYESEDETNMLHDIAGSFLIQRNHDQAERFAKKCLEVYSQVFGETSGQVTAILATLATIHISQERFGEALKILEKQEKVLKINFGQNHPRIAKNYSQRGLALMLLEVPEKAEKYLRKALALQRSLSTEDSIETSDSLNNLSFFLNQKKRYKESRELIHECLLMRRRIYKEQDHKGIIDALRGLSILFCQEGLYEKALPLIEECLSMSQRIYGEVHPEIVSTLINCSRVFEKIGDKVKVEQALQKALAIQTQLSGNNHPDVLQSYRNIINFYCSQEQYEKEEIELRKLLKIQQEILGNNHPAVINTLIDLSATFRNRRLNQKEAEILEEVILIQKGIFNYDHPELFKVIDRLTEIYVHSGNTVKIELLLEDQLRVQASRPEKKAVHIFLRHMSLIRHYIKQEKLFDAERVLVQLPTALNMCMDIGNRLFINVEIFVYSLLLDIYCEQKRLWEAEQLCKHVLLLEKVLGKRESFTLSTRYEKLANIYVLQKRYELAEEMQYRVLMMRERLPYNRTRFVNCSYMSLAAVYEAQQRYDEAVLTLLCVKDIPESEKKDPKDVSFLNYESVILNELSNYVRKKPLTFLGTCEVIKKDEYDPSKNPPPLPKWLKNSVNLRVIKPFVERGLFGTLVVSSKKESQE